MTMPPHDHGEQPGSPWSQPQYPPQHGQAGPPGAAGGPQPYYSPRPARPRSESAIAALVLGILGVLSSFFGAILAIVFGVVALVTIRKTGQRGGVMAIIGIVLGVMWTMLTVLFIVLAIHSAGHGNIGRLQAGDCFDNTHPGRVSAQVRLVSCTQPHNGQVVGTFMLPGNAWPGDGAVNREAATGCAAMLGSVLRQHRLGSGISGLNFSPDQQAWSSGTRAVTCVLLDPNATHTGSMLAGS